MKFKLSYLNPGPTNWLSDIFKKFGEKKHARKAFAVKLDEVNHAISAHDVPEFKKRLAEAKDFDMLSPPDFDKMLFRAVHTDDVAIFNAVLDARGQPNLLMCVEISPTMVSYQHILYTAITLGKEKIAKDLSSRADIEYGDSGFLLMGAEGERTSFYPLAIDAAKEKNMTGIIDILHARKEADAQCVLNAEPRPEHRLIVKY